MFSNWVHASTPKTLVSLAFSGQNFLQFPVYALPQDWSPGAVWGLGALSLLSQGKISLWQRESALTGFWARVMSGLWAGPVAAASQSPRWYALHSSSRLSGSQAPGRGSSLFGPCLSQLPFCLLLQKKPGSPSRPSFPVPGPGHRLLQPAAILQRLRQLSRIPGSWTEAEAGWSQSQRPDREAWRGWGQGRPKNKSVEG